MLNPLRPGAVLGPLGKTLSDLWAQLGGISEGLGVLPQLAADVAAIRAALTSNPEGEPSQFDLLLQRLSWLTGTEEPEDFYIATGGLPEYFRRRLGTATGAGSSTGSQFALLSDLRNNTNLVSQILNDNPPVSAANNILRQIRDASGGGTPPDNTAVIALLEAIRDGIKQTGELPDDASVFTLLRSLDVNVADIKECVCDDTTPPPDPFPTPTANCAGVAATWQECTLTLREGVGGAGAAVYAVNFPAQLIDESTLGGITNDSGLVEPSLGVVGAVEPLSNSFTVCMAWNFAAATPPEDYGLTTTVQNDGVAYFASSDSSGPVGLIESYQIQYAPVTSPTVRRVVQMNILFAGGTIPQGKVWVSIADNIA